MTIRLLPEIAVLYLLAFARIGAIVMLMPGFGETTVPVRVRLSIALMLSLLFHPLIAGLYPAGLARNPPAAIAMLAGELAIGLFLGLVTRMVLTGAQVAGATIANQLGLGFAMTIDPTQGQQGVIIGNFLAMLAVTLIFTTDLHFSALAAVTSSYSNFPPGGWLPAGDFAQMAVQLIGESFLIGVQISAPFLAFGLIFNLGVGMLQKMMPQFQLYFVTMPLSIGLGLILFAVTLATVSMWYLDHIREAFARLVVG